MDSLPKELGFHVETYWIYNRRKLSLGKVEFMLGLLLRRVRVLRLALGMVFVLALVLVGR